MSQAVTDYIQCIRRADVRNRLENFEYIFKSYFNNDGEEFSKKYVHEYL